MVLNNKEFFHTYGVLIVSSGGSGCSYLNSAIKQKFNTNKITNIDQMKHLYCPTSHLLTYNNVDKIIFVYNDPLISIISHFRRGWAIMQHKQICPTEEHIDYSILETKEKYFNYVKENKSDGFGVINHALRWKNYEKCLFVDLRNIEKTEQQISEYLKVNIPLKKTERSSNKLGVDDEVVSLYKKWDKSVI
jgi:hypothetical protein